MQKKNIVVIGARTLGLSIIKQLSNYNCEVLAIDKDMKKVEEADKYATHAIQVNTNQPEKIESVSLNTFDVAIVTVDDIEESIMLSLILKESGIPMVIVKASNETHKKILEKIGVDRVISPEAEVGVKLAKTIMNESVIDAINFSDDYSIIEIQALEKWVGKPLNKLLLRETYRINILCVKHANKELTISPEQNYTIQTKDILVVIADNKKIEGTELI